MSFDTRNEKWDGSPREFRQNQTRSSSPRMWRIEVVKDTIFCTWGQLGGAMQQVDEKGYAINIGKKNEVSALDYTMYLAREKCRKKHWEGYREVDAAGNSLDEHVSTVDFSNPAPNLTFWKPDNTPGAGILKKALNREVWYARKMNGLAYFLWSTPGGEVFMTSRRMLRQHDLEVGSKYTWNDRFPHIIEAYQRVMPPNSCVLGELVAFDKATNKDSLHLVEGYTKSLTPRALEDQARDGWAWHYSWDIAFWDGQDLVQEAPVEARYELIHKTFSGTPLIPVQFLTPQEENIKTGWYGSPDHMRELAKKLGWEGFVMVDPKGVFGDRAYNFKGKPDRPGKFAAKVKPEYEDDFIVFFDPDAGHGEWSQKGRYGANGIKSVELWQYNMKGELVYIANCSSGMTEEMKSDGDIKKFPQVWKVIYTDRRYQSKGDDTNAIDFPRYDSLREDKKPDECINPEL